MKQRVKSTAPNASTPLIKRLLSSKLITAHPVGGISVDFTTLEATKDGYVIGSVTRRVHFYCNAIDRNVAHAARIADHLVGESVRRPLHVAFFAGSNLFSDLMLGELVPALIAQGRVPFIFLPGHKSKKKANTSTAFDLRDLGFFERQLLQDHIIPLHGVSIPQGAPTMTVEQMRVHYSFVVGKFPKINDQAFLASPEAHHTDAGISLRCYQRFRSSIINYFASPHILLNLHPGILPAYKGIMTAFRSMMNNEPNFGNSLHHINEDYD